MDVSKGNRRRAARTLSNITSPNVTRPPVRNRQLSRHHHACNAMISGSLAHRRGHLLTASSYRVVEENMSDIFRIRHSSTRPLACCKQLSRRRVNLFDTPSECDAAPCPEVYPHWLLCHRSGTWSPPVLRSTPTGGYATGQESLAGKAGRQAGRLIDARLIDAKLTDWLAGRQAGWLADWRVGLAGRQADRTDGVGHEGRVGT